MAEIPPPGSGAAPGLAAGPPRLLSALTAIAVLALTLAAVETYVRAHLSQRLILFALRTSPAKLSGNILQTVAFRAPGVLPIYGSSELDRRAENRPDEFFRDRPTGFAAFPIGRGGTTCLMIVQKLAAAGSAVRGKKVVIILSPTWFLKGEVGDNAVAPNLAPSQLGAWLFGNGLSLELKQRIAARLLEYPSTLKDQPLLSEALARLADDAATSRLLLTALTPFGKAQNFLLRRVEYCAILRELLTYSESDANAAVGGEPAEAGATINWDGLAQEAETRDRAMHMETLYSAESRNARDITRGRDFGKRPPRDRDADFRRKIEESKEWVDLGLLLQTLRELGADAEFIDQPFNGIYRDYGGTSARARQVYYQKLAETIRPSGYRLVDFADHEEDRYFFNDSGHPSAKAWIFYNHALDDFYRARQHS